MRSEHEVAIRSGDVGRVPQVPRRVIGRNVEQLEIELVGLHLGRLVRHEAELAEYALDLALRLDQRMQRPARQSPSGERDVGSLAREPDVEGDLLQACTT